jgi:hypothetical protein
MRSFFRILFTPQCWFQNNPFSREWDRRLNALMRDHKFKRVSKHSAQLGPAVMWVANHPYASFSPEGAEVRPRRATVLKAMDKLLVDTLPS